MCLASGGAHIRDVRQMSQAFIGKKLLLIQPVIETLN